MAGIQNEDEVFGLSSSDKEGEGSHGKINFIILIIYAKYCFTGKKSRYTEPIMQNCAQCGMEYQTYVPNTDCQLPDGGVRRNVEAQIYCPDYITFGIPPGASAVLDGRIL